MKRIVLLLFFVFISITSFSQQFVQKWVFDDWLIYVGDIDGDNIGEFVLYDSNSKTTTFYDAKSHIVKWTINGKRFNEEIYSAEKSNLQPAYLKIPSIDFNGDGKKEMLFEPADGNGIIILDVVKNTNIFELIDTQISWTQFLALTDVDDDGKLEFIFVASYSSGYKTYVYSTEILTSNGKSLQEDIPNNYKLSQNYPNPFNPSTTIEFEILQPSNVIVNIYDVNGRFVQELINEQKNNGKYKVIWNGRDNSGNVVASGNYFYQIISGDFIQAKRMILLK